MTEQKQPKKHFFTFPQNWDDLTEKEQEEWVNQLYDRMITKLEERDKLPRIQPIDQNKHSDLP